MVACHAAVYGNVYAAGDLYGPELYQMQLAAFPEGQLVIELAGQIIGYATSLIVQLDDHAELYDYEQITGGGTFSTHDPAGDTLYGADIAVHPDQRGQGLAGLLYEHRKRLMKRFNLRRMLAYGRIPGYAAVAGKLTARQLAARAGPGRRPRKRHARAVCILASGPRRHNIEVSGRWMKSA